MKGINESGKRPSTRDLCLAFAGVAVATAVLGVRLAPDILESFHFSDFGTFYRAARSGVLYGPDVDLPTVGSVVLVNLNPPHFHLLYLPLTLLPLPAAYVAWMALTAAAIGGGLAWTARTVGARWPWWMWFVILAWTPLYSLVYTGQITALVFVALLFAWRADRKGRAVEAGLWMGVALAVKPHLLLVPIWWLFRSQWRSLAALVLPCLASVATGLAFYGWPAYSQWLSHLRSSNWVWMAMNSSLWALPSRLLQRTVYYTPLVDRPDLVEAWTVALVAPAVLVTFGTLLRERRPDAAWSVALTATSVVMPLGWTYYHWWWVPMTMVLPLSRRSWRVVAVCLALPVALVTPWASTSAWATLTVGSAPVYGALTVWVAVVAYSLRGSTRRLAPLARQPD